MKDHCKCRCENPINCPLKSEPDHRDLCWPLKREVFWSASSYPDPPLHQKKLTNREIRNSVDKNELWSYVPSWQVPRVESTCVQCKRLMMQNTPMSKIICMARRNMAFNGPVGELKVYITHFEKSKPKFSAKEDDLQIVTSEN